MGEHEATTVPGKVGPAPRKRGRKRKNGAPDEWPDWLPDGWILKTRQRKGGKVDKSYTCPISGRTFYTRSTVMHYLHFVLAPQESGYNADDPKLQTETSFRDGHISGGNKPEKSPVWLPKDWIMEVRVRKSGKSAGDKYKHYIDPKSRTVFRTKKDVLHYLETGEVSKRCSKKRKHPWDSQRIGQFNLCDLARFCKQETSAYKSLVTSSVGNVLEVFELHVDEAPCQNLRLALPPGTENASPAYMLMGTGQLEDNPAETVNEDNSNVTHTEKCLLGPLSEVPESKQPADLVPIPNTEASFWRLLDANDTRHLESKGPTPFTTDIKETKTPDLEIKEPPSISEKKEADHCANGYPPTTYRSLAYKSNKQQLSVRKSSCMRRAYAEEELHMKIMGKTLEPLETTCVADVPKPEVTVRTPELEKSSAHAGLLPDSSGIESEEALKVLGSTCLSAVAAGELAKSPASTCFPPQNLIKQLEPLGNLSKTPDISHRLIEPANAVPFVCAPSQCPSRSSESMKSRAYVGLQSENLSRSESPAKAAKKLPPCLFKTQEPIEIETASTDEKPLSQIKSVKIAASADVQPTEISSAEVEGLVKKPNSNDLPCSSCMLMKPLKQGPHPYGDPTVIPCKLSETLRQAVDSCKEQSQYSCKLRGLFDRTPLISSFELPVKDTPASPAQDTSLLSTSVPFDSVNKEASGLTKAEVAKPENMSGKLVEKRPSEKRASTNDLCGGSGPNGFFGTHSSKSRGQGWKSPSDSIPFREIVEVLDKVNSAGSGFRDGQAPSSTRGGGSKTADQMILLGSVKEKKPDVSELNLSESEDGSCEILEEKPPTQASIKAGSGVNEGYWGGSVSSRIRGRKMFPMTLFDYSKQKKPNQEDLSSELVEGKSTDKSGNIQNQISSSSARGTQGGSKGSSGSDRIRRKGEKKEASPLQTSMSSTADGTPTGVQAIRGRGRSMARDPTNKQSRIFTPSDKSMLSEKNHTPLKNSSRSSSRSHSYDDTRGGSISTRSTGRGKTVTPPLRVSMRLAGINPSIIISGAESPAILRRSTRLK